MEFLLAHCSALFSQHSSVLVALFLGGMTGGFTHCLVMCGGFSACQNACAGSACGTRSQRWQQRLNLPHHGGRMVSYGALGLVAGLLGRQFAANDAWPQVEAAMLFLAGMMFVGSSIASFMGASAHHVPLMMTRPLPRLVRGALLGFLPCGLIYAALMVVAASANPFVGALGMVLFVLGTLPALWLASLGVEVLSRRWREEMRQIGRVVMAMNGVALVVIAGKLVM